jgi:DNA polymerase II small subunit
MTAITKQQVVEYFIENEILLGVSTIEKINESNFDTIKSYVESKDKKDTLFLDEEINQVIANMDSKTVQKESEEKKEDENVVSSSGEIKILTEYDGVLGNVKILNNYNKEITEKKTVQDFVEMFRQRYKKIEAMLKNRQELTSITSINRVLQKKERDKLSIIGLVRDKQKTKNNHVVMTVEDLTGEIKVLITTNNEEAHKAAQEVSLDEVIGITGSNGDKVIFASTIVKPKVTIVREFKKAPDESYAVFVGDTHFGSKVFMKEKFEKFLKWINGNIGSEQQKAITKKIKYLFIPGDLVEGVGIYPGQEEDLEVKDIYDQYKIFTDFIKKLPPHLQIIIIPGNHDAVRLSEPQPPIEKEFIPELYDMKNVHLLSNPSRVLIHSSENFPGFEVLLYHGFSFPYYADNIESIREKGGQKRSDLIMQYLTDVRHLAPTHTSNLYSPDKKEDSMVIERAPDFFVTGHIHRVSAVNYKNITMLNCSSWLEETEYQRKVGLVPEPGRAVVVNLNTRDVKIMKF